MKRRQESFLYFSCKFQDISWKLPNVQSVCFVLVLGAESGGRTIVVIGNVNLYTEEKKFRKGVLVTQGERIRSILPAAELPPGEGRENVWDGEGCYAIPGMIDLHFHGCSGWDFCDGTREALDGIARYQASIGVTSICPATVTLPVPRLLAILGCAASYKRDQLCGLAPEGANLVGVNMEGPFISRARKGAQDERYQIPCSGEIFRRFQSAAEGLVKFIGIAPEEGDMGTFIEEVKDSVTVSLAHTDADYETASEAFRRGAKHVVHLYNAMSPFTQRAPGVVGAVFESGEDVTAEIICDGVHVHPAAVRTAFRMLGAGRMVLVSDSMRAAGLPEGRYTLGELEVVVKGKRAVLESDGSLAGSVTSLPQCMRYCVQEAHIPLEDAVACATVNPAKCLGIYEERGSLSPGKIADIVLLDRQLRVKRVLLGGVPLRDGGKMPIT